MGVSRSPAELVGKINKLERNVKQTATRQGLVPAATAMKQVMLRYAALSGLRPGSNIAEKAWRGAYIRNQGVNDLAVGYAKPAHLVNSHTREHDIRPKGFVGTRSTGRKAQRGAALLAAFGVDARKSSHPLLIPGVGFRESAHHPGTHGKHFFERSVPTAQREAVKAQQKQMVKAVTDAVK